MESLHIHRDRVIDQLYDLKRLKLPRYRGFGANPILGQVGDEPGMEGDVIYDRNSGRLCYHDGMTWVCLGDSAGGDCCNLADTLAVQNRTGGRSIIFESTNQIAEGDCGFINFAAVPPTVDDDGLLIKARDDAVVPNSDGCDLQLEAGNSITGQGGNAILRSGDAQFTAFIQPGAVILETGSNTPGGPALATIQMNAAGDGSVNITGGFDVTFNEHAPGTTLDMSEDTVQLNGLKGSDAEASPPNVAGSGGTVRVIGGTGGADTVSGSGGGGGDVNIKSGGGGISDFDDGGDAGVARLQGGNGGNAFEAGSVNNAGIGGDIEITGGQGGSGTNGNNAARGGEISIISGNGGTTSSGLGANGGNITIKTGEGGQFGGLGISGGTLTLETGSALIEGRGGDMNFRTGDGTAASASSGVAGNFTFTGGEGAVGGDFTVTAGPSDGSSGGSRAGQVIITGGIGKNNSPPPIGAGPVEGGLTNVSAGASETLAGGTLELFAGRSETTGTTGIPGGRVIVSSGNSGVNPPGSNSEGPSGEIHIFTPTVAVGNPTDPYNSGAILIRTGSTDGISPAQSGRLELRTGNIKNITGDGYRSGDVFIGSGNVEPSPTTPGDIVLSVGVMTPIGESPEPSASTFRFEERGNNAVHIQTVQINQPTVTRTGGNAGVPALLWGTDTAGVVEVTGADGAVTVRIDYYRAQADHHVVTVSPMNSLSTGLHVDFSMVDNTGFNVVFPFTSPGSTFRFSYHVISATDVI